MDPLTGTECGIASGELSKIETFDDFYAAYIRQLDYIIESIITCADDFEQYLHEVSPAQVYSATIENSLKTAKDAFHDGSVYNISAILNAGFATAVDALMVIKEFVFEKQELSLIEFRDILKADWKGHEKLRLKVLRYKNKFGNGIEEVDAAAEGLALFLANKINLRPNARNGFYVIAMHSARAFIRLGQKTGATPDGRLAGEEMSKNISPTMGMDVNGVTALIKSVTRIDSALFPGDFALDVMMHPATVQGEDGLAAMRTLMKTYMDKHGISIQFNIFDARVLLNAQKHPEKYEGLQVRVCGWNVRFNDIDKKEQDAYIKRALSISE
jgi:formate C-acetyltransferase